MSDSSAISITEVEILSGPNMDQLVDSFFHSHKQKEDHPCIFQVHEGTQEFDVCVKLDCLQYTDEESSDLFTLSGYIYRGPIHMCKPVLVGEYNVSTGKGYLSLENR